MAKISNWGNYPAIEADMRAFDGADAARQLVSDFDTLICRGMGRSYGDASLAPHIASTLKHNKILAFNPDDGLVTCQSGVTLKDLLDVFVPRGWFLPVTPGTKFVTVGGAIAVDVHGKNHHKDGSFCRHVTELQILMADGTVRTCSSEEEPDLFSTTCGGMGLTGVILSATIRLRRIETAYIREEIVEARNLDHIMELFDQSTSWTYSVAWIDCLARGDKLGRSLLMRGEHATPDELDTPARKANPLVLPAKRKLSVPIQFPPWVLNSKSVSAFNTLYHWKHAHGTIKRVVDYDAFFYPLDFIHDWNRIYGRPGFVQYQFVLPLDQSHRGLVAILEQIASSGWGSFLAVLKLFGPDDGFMSFPMEGYTLALDFAVTDALLPFLDELDERVAENGGRIYLAKDARMKPGMFAKGYPNAEAFAEQVRRFNPDLTYRSNLSDRLGITPRNDE